MWDKDKIKNYVENDKREYEFIDAEFKLDSGNKNKWYITFKCNNNHISTVGFKHFRNGCKCRHCNSIELNKSRTLLLEDIKENAINLGFTILSDKYINTDKLLMFKCSEDHIFERSWSGFRINSTCPECNREVERNKAYWEIRNIIENNGGKILSKNYIDSKTPIDFICGCGREYSLNSVKLKISNGFCPLCRYERSASKLKFLYEEVKQIFIENDCILITDNYINSFQELEFICSCGNHYKKQLSSFLQSPMCYKCGINNRSVNRTTTYEEVYDFYKENNCELLITKDEYINKSTYADFICNCGKQGYKQIVLFYKNPFCKECGIEQGVEKRQYDYDYIKKFIEENNCVLKTTKDNYENTNTSLEIQCSCRSKFTTTFALFKHENKRQCTKCGIKLRSGENSPFWKGGVSSERDKISQTKEYKDWREGVYKKDNYTCQCCNDNAGHNLRAHHLESFSANEDLRYKINNGITLCDKCHNPNQYGSFHNIYGTKNNTREQFEEYIKRYNDGEFNELKLKNIG